MWDHVAIALMVMMLVTLSSGITQPTTNNWTSTTTGVSSTGQTQSTTNDNRTPAIAGTSSSGHEPQSTTNDNPVLTTTLTEPSGKKESTTQDNPTPTTKAPAPSGKRESTTQDNPTSTTKTTPVKSDSVNSDVITSESVIIAGFRLWHIVGLALCGILFFTVIICCCTNCRIPRSKAEVEANYEKRKLNTKYEKELNRITLTDFPVPDTSKNQRGTKANTRGQKNTPGIDNEAFDIDVVTLDPGLPSVFTTEQTSMSLRTFPDNNPTS